MQNKNLLRLIDKVAKILDLDEAVLEKDYYVTQVIHTVSKIENEYFRLIKELNNTPKI